MEKILINRIRCRVCGDIIESRDVHETVTCSCGRVSVEGGHEYLRRYCKDGPKDIEELSVVEHDDEEEADEGMFGEPVCDDRASDDVGNNMHTDSGRIPGPPFKSRDTRIAFYKLQLEQPLDAVEELPLPEGFSYVNYKPGDKQEWIRIEQSAEEFESPEDGEKAWANYFEGKDDELRHRMFFVENRAGEKVATASAFYNIYTGDDGINGWLHWVAVQSDAQGKGLSKPLITHVLSYMKELGYRNAVIPTQTTTWLACRIYLNLRFLPTPENAVSGKTGWKIIRRLTGHPALSGFEEADDNELYGTWDET